MKKINILRISLVGALAFLVYYIIDAKGGDWKFEDAQTKCLNQPLAIVPLIMPLDKPYLEYFSALSYKFPSWWAPQLDDAHYNLMPIVDTIPVTHPSSEKIVVDGKDAWFTYSPDSSLARYDTQTNELKLYNIPDKRNRPFQVSDIYLAQDGTLWTILNSPQPKGGYSVLARYRLDNNTFEIIADQDGVLARSEETLANPSDKKLAELPDGKLAVVLDGNIYLYYPATNQAKLLLGNRNVESIAAGKGDNIWFVNHYEDFDLRAVNARTGKVTDYGVPPQLGNNYKIQPDLLDATKAIAVDYQGRIWVSYFDRLEFDTNGNYRWHSMKLPPVFVNTFDPFFVHRWADVFSAYVFSDGSVWFASDIGIVRYDVNKNDWCLSANVKTFASYPITEDATGNVWTIVDNQIYELTP